MPKYELDGLFDPQRATPDDAHSILMRLIPSRSRVLELGCSTGYLSGYMTQALGCEVTGLEYDPAAVAIAQTRCHAAYVADLDDLQVLDVVAHGTQFDVVLAAAVLEHLKYPDRLLQMLHRLLTPNGCIIISLPNIAHWQIRLMLLRGRFDYDDYGIMDRTHLRFFTVDTACSFITDNGYVVEDFHIAGSALQNWLNGRARRAGQALPAPVLPGLLGYELIYVAKPVG